MNCIIVDDEPLAREGMVDLVKTQGELLLKGTFNNAIKANEFLKNNSIDLIFLDIEMPGVNGLEFAKNIPEKTLVIFTTAYKEYAIESYAVDAVDYLLKPILYENFERAVNKALSFNKLLLNVDSEIENITKDFLFIKAERRYYKILFNKILFIEGLKDYVVLYTENDKIITAMNLKTIHTKLPKTSFIRVSKSYIVNEVAIESFDNHTIYIKDYEIPIGKLYQENFHKQYLNKEL
ncbi:LytR/AlgR family response regulator transcription factor [Lutibacter aestuarii]|uniref:LytR/AlgR family response regulator transcription factor n=1 Tax=Lutibacter aestuarii TaxID=861111 RepID=A0ABW2ZA03_9FLAO